MGAAGSVQLTNTRNKEVFFQKMEIEDLTHACRVGDHNTVVTLLKSGNVDVNERDRRNVTALMWAMGRNHIPIVSTLLANPTIQLDRMDVSGGTALHWACSNNHSAVIALFCQHKWCRPATLNKKAKDGSTALQCAVYWDNLECVEELDKLEIINFKAKDDNGDTVLELARKQNSERVIKFLLARRKKVEPLLELSASIVAKHTDCETDIRHLEIPFSLHRVIEKFLDI